MTKYRTLISALAIAMVATACGGATDGESEATSTTRSGANTTSTSTAPSTTSAAGGGPTTSTTTAAAPAPELPSELLWYAAGVNTCGLIAAVFADTVVYSCPRDTEPFRAFDIATGAPADALGYDKLATLFDGSVVGSSGQTVQVLGPDGEADRPAFTLPERGEYLVGDFGLVLTETIATVAALDSDASTDLTIVDPPRNADFDEAGDMIQYMVEDGALLALSGGLVERLDPATLTAVWSLELPAPNGSPAFVPSVQRARKASAARHLAVVRTADDSSVVDLMTGEVKLVIAKAPSRLHQAGVSYEEDGGGACRGSAVLSCYLGFDGSVVGSAGLEDNGKGLLGPVTGLADGTSDVVINGRFFVGWPGGGPTEFAERDPAEVWSVSFESIGVFPQGGGCDFAIAGPGLVGQCGGVPMLIK